MTPVEAVNKLKAEKHITVAKIVEHFGVNSPGTIGNMLKKDKSNMTTDSLLKFCELFGYKLVMIPDNILISEEEVIELNMKE